MQSFLFLSFKEQILMKIVYITAFRVLLSEFSIFIYQIIINRTTLRIIISNGLLLHTDSN